MTPLSILHKLGLAKVSLGTRFIRLSFCILQRSLSAESSTNLNAHLRLLRRHRHTIQLWVWCHPHLNYPRFFQVAVQHLGHPIIPPHRRVLLQLFFRGELMYLKSFDTNTILWLKLLALSTSIHCSSSPTWHPSKTPSIEPSIPPTISSLPTVSLSDRPSSFPSYSQKPSILPSTTKLDLSLPSSSSSTPFSSSMQKVMFTGTILLLLM